MKSSANKLPTHCWPVDKNAAAELYAEKPEAFTSRECPALCKTSIAEIKKRNGAGFRDLTGQRNGAMVIVGLRAYRENKRSSWIALCDCGNYEQRNHRNWQKYLRKGVPDACYYCMPKEFRIAVIAAILGPTNSPKGTRNTRNDGWIGL